MYWVNENFAILRHRKWFRGVMYKSAWETRETGRKKPCLGNVYVNCPEAWEGEKNTSSGHESSKRKEWAGLKPVVTRDCFRTQGQELSKNMYQLEDSHLWETRGSSKGERTQERSRGQRATPEKASWIRSRKTPPPLEMCELSSYPLEDSNLLTHCRILGDCAHP